MSNAPGRPSKACDICKKQKICNWLICIWSPKTFGPGSFDCAAGYSITQPGLLSWDSTALGQRTGGAVLRERLPPSFYRDESGNATLKEQGLMTKWAKTAGSLVFQEAEELSDDNLVTFCNLSLFWHSQGNACQLLHIIGTGPRNSTSLEAEIRRRRFWACYLFHCFSSEKLFRFEAIADIEALSLPWPEEEFATGVSPSSIASIGNKVNSGSVFAELIRGLHLWSSVVSVVRSDAVLNSRLQEIFRVENDILAWWHQVPSSFKLEASSISVSNQKGLPKVLLTNLVYHQCLCALHSSIVPLFCWSRGDKTYSSARQLSAQVAFEHAGYISSLIAAALAIDCSLSAMPLFVAYAAYSSCAVQMPFLWCSEPSVAQRAQANIQANAKMLQGMSRYWKLASLLHVYGWCLHDVHKRNPPKISNEPKYADASVFTDFTIDASLAKVSILEFTGILRSGEHGFVKPGEETQDPTSDMIGDAAIVEPGPMTESHDINELSDVQASAGSHSGDLGESGCIGADLPMTRDQIYPGFDQWPAFDVFNSLFNADITSLLPMNDDLDLSFLETDLFSWDLTLDGRGRNPEIP
ncbi:hypothetical protein F53441_8341 [Fusarium austroafricanum]|uniref:Xylanolytic transcriptional activator regulatory domain-containing protein n=1 Tax=Fusarium austroafricanum TaxID=2364996 RepID=A0A8H4KEE1_9HYPO|nr:hypothetical protein F53441_8341 [Fusarium austroafricanum]